MAGGSLIYLADDDKMLKVVGHTILSDVPHNIYLSSSASTVSDNSLTPVNGAFIGVLSDHIGSRRIFPLGKLLGLRFMCLYRFKLWWMTQCMGTNGRQVPCETQFLMVEVPNGSVSDCGQAVEDGVEQSVLYTVFLPILEGDFRAVLQGNPNDELEICLESGDPDVQEFDGSHLVFVAAGSDPFDVVENSLKAIEGHLQTFCHRDKKKMPDMLNWFGWCTWDAFYTDVTAEGVRQGVDSLKRGGIPPRFVIIDDGWQSVDMDSTSFEAKAEDTANFSNRLTHITENHKFQKGRKEGSLLDDTAMGIGHIVTEIKDQHDVKYVYMWHAITGYWGGVSPSIADMAHYESILTFPVSSPGIQENGICFVLNSITINGVGLVNPNKVFDLYNELHSYLSSAGVDGVKVDVQSILETLGAGNGGRVNLTRKYHQALEDSIERNFRDNGIISCMSHHTDSLYSGKRTAIIRASDDFFPRDPASHTVHVAAVAYNTLFIGEFMQPDWDMFHSLHPMAEYHGAARAVGGCAIYVSDKPGQHDFDLLKKLVLPDGSILRAKLPGRPTRDCLFSDPTRDGKSLLKIWNLNKFNGVLGIFNCQGAAWCKAQKRNLTHDEQPNEISGLIRAKDVNHLPKVAHNGWTGDAILYSHRGGEVAFLPKNKPLLVTLKGRAYEVFTVVPIKELSNGATFAPVGLIWMFNSGAAIKELEYESQRSGIVDMKVCGSGSFGAYSSLRPRRITVDGEETEFNYEQGQGLIVFQLLIPQKELYLWYITIEL